VLRHLSRANLSTRIIGITVLAAILPLVAFAVVATIEGRHLREELRTSFENEARQQLRAVTHGVLGLVRAQHQTIQEELGSALAVANDTVRASGGIRPVGGATAWTATNQFDGTTTSVTLPRLGLGAAAFGQETDPGRPVPLVDRVTRLSAATCTVFQRMNEAGDMLRVATTVVNKAGRRGVGTFIPAVQPDGETNAVVRAVMAGETYRGRAFVVDAWYQTAYQPLRDPSGRITGMLYVGIRQDRVPALREAILAATVGKSGYVFVLEGKGKNRGTYVVSRNGERDGENILETRDPNGRPIIQEMIAQSIAARPGEVTYYAYPWKNKGESSAREKIAALVYVPEWDWVVGASAYRDEFEASSAHVTDSATAVFYRVLLVTVAFVAFATAVGTYIARGIAKPVGELAAAADRIAVGDVDQRIEHRSHDEVGRLAESFRSLVAYIRDVAAAAEGVSRGDVSVKLTPRSDADVLSQSMGKAIVALQEVTRETRALSEAGRDGRLTTRADASRFEGAFREMVEGVNGMLDAVLAPVDEAARTLRRIEQHDLTARVEGEYHGDHAAIKRSINAMADDLSRSMGEIARTATALAAASEQLTATSRTMGGNAGDTSSRALTASAASEQISANIDSVAAAAEEMSGSVREIARNASDAAGVATTAVKAAEETQRIVVQLRSSSEEIEKVAKMIATIAEQTNLLALNATIEAARAGEAGHGFAVVASEVKDLAKATSGATEEIAVRIATIRQDTRSAVDAIAKIQEVIRRVHDISTSIAGAVEEQTATTNEISRNVQDAARGGREIAQAISTVAKAAEGTAAGASEGLGAAAELARMAAELQSLTGRFRI
jgi:methyl-accepting chemotaxis protein